MSKTMLCEISRKVININNYEETNISWNNSVITVRGIKDLHLLEFSYNLNSLDKGIDFKEFTLSCSKNSPLPNDYLPTYVSRGVNNFELEEMVANPAFWPHNKLLMEELTKITAYQWSPFHLVSESNSLLAVLNSVGNIEFFVMNRHTWSSILDYSSEIKAHLIEKIGKLNEVPRKFSDVKKTVYLFVTSSICWASDLEKDNSCYFVTAQKSGDILFWTIKYQGNFKIKLCGIFESSPNVEIVNMVWINMKENKHLLVCSNEFGEIIIYECEIAEKKVMQLQEHNVWPHKDKMLTTHICYHFDNDKLLLCFNKYWHLVIQMYDKDLNLLSQCVQNVNDYKITSITIQEGLFYLTTVNVKIYKVNYSIKCDTLQVSFEAVAIKDMGSSYELYGIAFSRNKALCALAMINRKLLRKKETVNIEVVFLCSDNGCEIMDFIHNKHKKLTHIWDTIEVFRCKVMKTKRLPEFDYSLLLKDDSDMYNHKVYLIFLQLYHNAQKCLGNNPENTLPETSIEYIKEKILMLQAFTQIHNLYSANFQNNLSVNNFDLETFAGCKNYLNYFCKKYNQNINNLIAADILDISNVCFKYICQWCEETMVDYSCKNKHVNMICSITYTPIEDDYLLCKNCNATARIELCNQNLTCVFCDIHLIKSDLIY